MMENEITTDFEVTIGTSMIVSSVLILIIIIYFIELKYI